MPKFRNREEYEEWKAAKLHGSRERLRAESAELSTEGRPANPPVAPKKGSQRITCPKCSSSEVDIILSGIVVIRCLQCGHSWTPGQPDWKRFAVRATKNNDSITRTGWTGIVLGVTLVILGISIAMTGLFFGTASGKLFVGVLIIILLGVFIAVFCFADARS